MSASTHTLAVMQAATSRFVAARQVDMLPVGHRCRRMHGHGFTATAYSAVPADWVAYPGGEVVALQQRVDRCAGVEGTNGSRRHRIGRDGCDGRG